MAIEVADNIRAQASIVAGVGPTFRGTPIGFTTVERTALGDYTLTLDEPLPENQRIILTGLEGVIFGVIGNSFSGDQSISIVIENGSGAGLDINFNILVLAIPRREVVNP